MNNLKAWEKLLKKSGVNPKTEKTDLKFLSESNYAQLASEEDNNDDDQSPYKRKLSISWFHK